jgi:hypothetical protein
MDFDWKADCTFNYEQKRAFHLKVKRALVALAKALGVRPTDYTLRSNMAGISVSGEITLHTNTLYIQVSQTGINGETTNVLARSCNGRKDYTGGANQWISYQFLDDIPAFVERLRGCCLIPYDEDA